MVQELGDHISRKRKFRTSEKGRVPPLGRGQKLDIGDHLGSDAVFGHSQRRFRVDSGLSLPSDK